jgi:hypothetical protein
MLMIRMLIVGYDRHLCPMSILFDAFGSHSTSDVNSIAFLALSFFFSALSPEFGTIGQK